MLTQPLQSAQLLRWEDPDGNTGYFNPNVLQYLPVNLWGREMLEQMEVLITSPISIATSGPFKRRGMDWVTRTFNRGLDRFSDPAYSS